MNRRIVKVTLTTVALMLTASLCFAYEEYAKQPAEGKPAKSAKKNATSKKVSNVKLIDINSASKEALRKLPGITDVYADKIIAGRPYSTKIRLQTENIVSAEVFAGINHKIIAKQPFKDSSQNAAIYSKNK